MAENIPLDPNAPWAKVHQDLDLSLKPWDGKSLQELLSEHAVRFADRPAIQYFDRTFSYADYQAKAEALANGLASIGVGAGDVVGIHLPNIPQYGFALAAISRLGAIGTGVSPLLTADEIVYQVQDANAKVLISLDSFLASTSGRRPTRLP